ncbi:MAG: type II toxin-antitoxin system ParD family antitoxin [Steroidobacteraceae bacterium]
MRDSYTGKTMPTTAVKLPAALEKFVDSQVREGTYRNREAAIVAAVSQQKRRSEQLAWLQSEIQKGLDSGPTGELDIENVIRRGRRRVVARARRVRS